MDIAQLRAFGQTVTLGYGTRELIAQRIEWCADRIAELERENAELKTIVRARTHRENGCICEQCVADEYETAKVVEEVRKDAERYRWLRKIATYHGAPIFNRPKQGGYWWEMLVPYLPGEHKSLDDAIDALHL